MSNSRDNKGRFAPGQSGNPLGSPSNSRSLAQLIRDQSNQGQELIDFLLSVLRDEALPHNLRLQAANMLLDRGFGKPTTEIDVQLGLATERPLAHYSLEELNSMLKVLPDEGEETPALPPVWMIPVWYQLLSLTISGRPKLRRGGGYSRPRAGV